jgi:hypothetical protein
MRLNGKPLNSYACNLLPLPAEFYPLATRLMSAQGSRCFVPTFLGPSSKPFMTLTVVRGLRLAFLKAQLFSISIPLCVIGRHLRQSPPTTISKDVYNSYQQLPVGLVARLTILRAPYMMDVCRQMKAESLPWKSTYFKDNTFNIDLKDLTTLFRYKSSNQQFEVVYLDHHSLGPGAYARAFMYLLGPQQAAKVQRIQLCLGEHVLEGFGLCAWRSTWHERLAPFAAAVVRDFARTMTELRRGEQIAADVLDVTCAIRHKHHPGSYRALCVQVPLRGQDVGDWGLVKHAVQAAWEREVKLLCNPPGVD